MAQWLRCLKWELVRGGWSLGSRWIAPLIFSGLSNIYIAVGLSIAWKLISMWSVLSNLYHFYSLYSARRYVGTYLLGFRLPHAKNDTTRTILERHHDHIRLSQPFSQLTQPPSNTQFSKSWKQPPCSSVSRTIFSTTNLTVQEATYACKFISALYLPGFVLMILFFLVQIADRSSPSTSVIASGQCTSSSGTS
jgi:hypothetical protein